MNTTSYFDPAAFWNEQPATTKLAARVATRAINRILAPIEKFWEADRQFDAGEWSDGCHDEMRVTIERRIEHQVADHYGITNNELIHTMLDLHHAPAPVGQSAF